MVSHSIIIDQLVDLIFNQQMDITCNFVSKYFEIHISEAFKILEEFVSKNKNKLTINYLLNGVDDSEDGSIKLQRFLIVDQNDLESSKAILKNSKISIYSIRSLNNNNQNLNFEKFLFEPKTDNISRVQSLTYIRNSQIKFRPLPRACYGENLKYDEFNNANNKVKVKSEIQDMDIDMKNVDSPNKRLNTKDDDDEDVCVKRFKRVKKLDSDDEDDDKMKGNSKTNYNSKLVKDETSQEKVVKQEFTNSNLKEPNSNSVLKFKTKTQTSITSFFKKPNTKK